MQDVLIKQNDDGLYDLVVEGADFASAEGFETAIAVSLFTDARALPTYVQEAKNRRGWVGNILTEERQLGGLLWLLDQTRMTNDTINFARGYADGSLQWIIDDGVARVITVVVTKINNREMNIYIDITEINNTVKRYVTLWRNTNLERIL